MQQPTFSEGDLAEARRLLARLDRLPRLRMTTVVGRWTLNTLLRVTQAVVRSVPRADQPETREVTALGRTVGVRIFRPADTIKGVLIEIHGGGWTIGNARLSDAANLELVTATGLAVVSIDYRLAVNHKLADVVADCVAAALWTIENVRAEFGTDRLVLRGDSAGAHLAALTVLALRDQHRCAGALRGVLLSFGIYDFAGTPSVRQAGREVLILHGPTIRATLRKLSPGLSDEERRAPSLSPLYADLRDLPPALFVVGDQDVLLEDSRLMEARWRGANSNSEIFVVPQTPHAIYALNTAIAGKARDYAFAWLLRQVDTVASGQVG